MNIEVLKNGYTVIHKTDKYVLAYKPIDEFARNYVQSKFEYATWQFGVNHGTVYGHYAYDIGDATEDYITRNEKEYVTFDLSELNQAIGNFIIREGK